MALIDKAIDQSTLSIHRLVQSAVFHRLADSERSRYFDTVVQLLSWGFPDTWSEDVGHQINAWERCEKRVPHIYHLAKLVKRHSIRPSHGQKYAELLLRFSWYVDIDFLLVRHDQFLTKLLLGTCMNERHTTSPEN